MSIRLDLVVSLFLLAAISISINATKVEITRRIENKGYHRLLLLENFDKNLYVDVYELRQSMYEKMYTFFLSNKVNTETAGYKSQNFQTLLYLNKSEEQLICGEEESLYNMTTIKKPGSSKLNCKLIIKLPIHVRYHSPKSSQYDNRSSSAAAASTWSQVEALDEATVHDLVENGTIHEDENDDDHDSIDHEGETNEYFRFRIRKPRLFFSDNCTANTKITKQSGTRKKAEKIDDIELPCFKNKSLRNDYLFLVPDDLNVSNITSEWLVNKYKSACKWRLFRFDQLNQSDSLIIQIPTGNRDHEVIILIVTCVILTFLAFSLAKWVRKKITSLDYCGSKRRGKSNDKDEQANANDDSEAKDLNPKS